MVVDFGTHADYPVRHFACGHQVSPDDQPELIECDAWVEIVDIVDPSDDERVTAAQVPDIDVPPEALDRLISTTQ